MNMCRSISRQTLIECLHTKSLPETTTKTATTTTMGEAVAAAVMGEAPTTTTIITTTTTGVFPHRLPKSGAVAIWTWIEEAEAAAILGSTGKNRPINFTQPRRRGLIPQERARAFGIRLLRTCLHLRRSTAALWPSPTKKLPREEEEEEESEGVVGTIDLRHSFIRTMRKSKGSRMRKKSRLIYTRSEKATRRKLPRTMAASKRERRARRKTREELKTYSDKLDSIFFFRELIHNNNNRENRAMERGESESEREKRVRERR